jgi:hypothetical protein
MWVHLSEKRTNDTHIRPPAETAWRGSFRADAVREDAIRRGHLNPDLVSLMEVNAACSVGNFTFAGDDPYCYEVEPEGHRFADPDPTALPNWACFRRARIIRLLSRPAETRSNW